MLTSIAKTSKRPRRQPWIIAAVTLLLLLSGCSGEPVVQIHGKGATFPAPLYQRWIALFERARPDIEIHYSAVGSGAGIRVTIERTAHFGASDALLTAAQQQQLPADLLILPMVLGPVVMAYNLPDFDAELTLDGDTIAAIYLGQITRWNDSRLAALNPGVDLPDLEIHVAHRADASGTSFIFTDYLSAVSVEWREQVGKGTEVNWPTGDEWAGIGNDGVAHRILLLPGGIGYLEIKYALNAGLEYAALINRSGERVWPTVAGVQAAESNTPAPAEGVLKPSIVNAPGAVSYPICGFTYLLVYRQLDYFDNPLRAQALVDFLRWALTEGQTIAPELHYTPLPEELRQATLGLVETIELPEHEQE